MKVKQPPSSAEEVPVDRQRHAVADALRTLETFTRDQVAWLMAQAQRWGYEARDAEDRGFWAGYQARVAEENAAWPDDTVLFRHHDVVVGINQRAYRAECDRAARVPRIGDHAGGPVRWDEANDGQVAA